MKPQLQVLWTEIKFIKFNDDDFINFTDIARHKNPSEPRYVIQNWMKTRFSIEFLWLWETLNNPDFKGVEFDTFKSESWLNAFLMNPKNYLVI